jgi:hypothetical protein
VLFNNFLFYRADGLIVVVGTYFAYRQRFREFVLRFELDKNRAALEESNQKLVELDQIKSRFFANISHELRTPLTLLLAPLETLMQKFNRSFDNETREVLATMHSNGMRPAETDQRPARPRPTRIRPHGGESRTARSRRVHQRPRQRGAPGGRRQTAPARNHVDPQLEHDCSPTATSWRRSSEPRVQRAEVHAGRRRVEIAREKQAEEFVLVVADTGMGIPRRICRSCSTASGRRTVRPSANTRASASASRW